MLRDYYTAGEAAEEWGLSIFQVYRRIHAGVCFAEQHGREYFIPKTEVERLKRETPLDGRYRRQGAGGGSKTPTTVLT